MLHRHKKHCIDFCSWSAFATRAFSPFLLFFFEKVFYNKKISSLFFSGGARRKKDEGVKKKVKRVKVPLVAKVTIQKSALQWFCDEEAFLGKKE